MRTFSKNTNYLQTPQYLLQRRQGAVRKLCQRQVHRSPACRRPPEVRLERERVLDVWRGGGQSPVLAGQVGHWPESVEQRETASVSS